MFTLRRAMIRALDDMATHQHFELRGVERQVKPDDRHESVATDSLSLLDEIRRPDVETRALGGVLSDNA